ncbi:MAG TPA: flippase [Solirubrobacteraceae bacterium]|nr:flippase [Solirubrobacteraceae bacterium]
MTATEAPEGSSDSSDATSRHLRGSTALLAGRLVALGVDFAVHVIIVRYLTKADYGAFSYALAVASLMSTVVVLGLPETLGRFVPIFQERRAAGRLLGSVLIALAIVTGVGLLCVLVVVGAQDRVADALASADASTLLAILVLLVPLDGVNLVLQSLFAALGRVRAIFLRQYVIVPALRLIVAVALVSAERGAQFLAIGWVSTSALGLLFYGALAGGSLRGALRRRIGAIEWPVREVVGFALPVFLTNVFWIVLLAFSTIALGVMVGERDVAAFQAVLPPARLNYLALAIFAILFLPTIARQHEQRRFDDLRATYIATTMWLVVLTFPIFALTTVFAPEFVTTFFGTEYESSGVVLILLAAGYYVHTAAGPNSATLKVFRRLRYTVVIDLLALAFGIALNLVLIPIAGATGAAAAFLGALIGRNLPYLWALKRIAGISLLTADYLRVQVTVVASLAGLLALREVLAPGLAIAIALTALAGLGVLAVGRRALLLSEAFPELRRGRLGRFL